ncbi:MAG: endo-1,4-beta-xylanase [Candidatus Limnocylindrales bacterium]
MTTETTDALIRRHRTADAAVTILGPDGPLANREVVVSQRSHAFRFGCTGFEMIELANHELDDAAAQRAERAAADWLELYNFATLPFYWARFEPTRGRPDTQRLLNAAHWFVDRGCQVKGHPLCWHSVTADWLLDLTDDEIVDAQLARIRRDVADFAGVIDTWDVINEVVIMPVFAKYDNGISRMSRTLGRVGIVRATFDAARTANPGATLLLNDFDMSVDYEHLVEDCLEAGIRIDALGLQSHMHQGYWGEAKTEDVLGRFARFGLPVHFTESTLVSGRLMPPEIVDLNDYQVDDWASTPEGEARQADEIVRHYRTLLAHPGVEAITWWGFPDGGWLNAPTGLIRIDGSRKPAFDALHGLIKGAWWLPPTPLVTDDTGTVRFNGFLGEYALSSGADEATFRIETTGTAAINVRLGDRRLRPG